ncbi:MAG: Tex family protein [Candidatus Hodarchaeales archaeon]
MAIDTNLDEIKLIIINNIASTLNVKSKQVIDTLNLLEKGNTVPFISRYRKEVTGSLDETQIRAIDQTYKNEIMLHNEKERVIETIKAQGKLTEELEKSIRAAQSMGELHEIYKPYKQKKKTRGQVAREKGLEPLAKLIRFQDETQEGTISEIAKKFIEAEKELNTEDDCLAGARDIIAEDISLSTEIRDIIKQKYFKTAKFTTKLSILYKMDVEEDPNSEKAVQGKKYEQYFEYEEDALSTPPHRLLAMIRGDREGILSFKVVFNEDAIVSAIKEEIMLANEKIEGANVHLALAIEDSWKRLLGPSMMRELKRTQLEKAEEHSIKVFAENLKHLLLTPPVKERILGIDPAYRTGCKYAAIDETGTVLTTGTIFPHKPQEQWEKSKKTILSILEKYNIKIVAIGNGTASRETERLVAELAKGKEIKYVIVSEAGASVYSASDLAREEFPNLDVTIRGAISIARRLQDPLAELVKIDPKSIGVGQYQHDLPGLSIALRDVVVDTVNMVGVDVNTASKALLKYVSGITKSVAKNILEFRNKNGAFIYRDELTNVPGIGPRTFEQAVGFLRIPGSPEPFDNSPIHPESYELAEELLRLAKVSKNDLLDKITREKLQRQLRLLNPTWAAKELKKEDRIETIKDIIQTLQNPFRDPREDFDKPLLKSEVLSIEDINIGMEVEGTITNVVDFGVFVDIGVKTNGLIHISEMSDSKFIRHPRDAGLKVGDIVKARVKDIDLARKRISLSLKSPDAKKKTIRTTGEKAKAGSNLQGKRQKPKKRMSMEDKKFETLMKNGKIQL